MNKEQKVGLFFFFGILAAFGLIEMTAGTGWFKSQYHLWVEYRDVQGLNPGDAVRLAGLKKGSVDEVQIAEDRVRVRLRLDDDAVVRRDSVARLDFQALSGTRFVAISLGSPGQPVLHDGDTIDGATPAGMTDMIDRLSSVASGVEALVDSLNRNQDELLGNINELLEENRRSVTAVLANLASISEKVDRGDGSLAKLLNEPGLYDQVEQLTAEATDAVADLRAVSARLAGGEGTLGRLVQEDDLYDETREAVASLNTTLRNLEEVSNDVRDGRGTLGRLLSDDSLYVEAQDAVRGLDRATAGIEDQSPIAILGTLVSTLF